MKKLSLTLFLALICSCGFAQIANKDSLKQVLKTTKVDSIKFKTLTGLSNYYRIRYPDTSFVYAKKALAIATKSKDIRKISFAQNLLSRVLTYMGNYPLALDYAFESQKNYEILKDTLGMINSNIGSCFKEQGDIQNALKYTLKAKQLSDMFYVNYKERTQYQIGFYSVLSSIYEKDNQLDLAIAYADTVLKYRGGRFQSAMMYVLGKCYSKKGQYTKAMAYFKQLLPRATKLEYHKDLLEANTGIAFIFKERKQLDSAIYYCQKALGNPYGKLIPKYQLEASSMIADIYESQHKIDSAFKYLKQTIALKDTLFNQGKTIAIQNLIFKEEQKKKELEEAELKFQNRLKIYGLIGGLAVLFLVALLLWRNNRHKQKANNLLQEQKDKVESTLSKLKSTQNQLIQSEKLASLGELTAGIAHEIQNPLNFVNNFAEMSVGLAQELQEEIKKPEKDWELIDDLANDLSQNQEKINFHGKRASSIVTGMLQHSQASSGKKELTDINKLADESLRLSYHGLRAKDKNSTTDRFNADFELISDPNLPKINVISQDIGRVLINLINNAFYAVNVGRTFSSPAKVIVSTKKLENTIEIKVKDNGIGMNEATKAKIFQPFFTTKPTGQGTGLGLSLAYDIVTKGHGGTIGVESVEGEGSTFIVKLPIV